MEIRASADPRLIECHTGRTKAAAGDADNSNDHLREPLAGRVSPLTGLPAWACTA